jgi:hypothetical protein
VSYASNSTIDARIFIWYNDKRPDSWSGRCRMFNELALVDIWPSEVVSSSGRQR